jgi:hypothetical protein
LGKKRSAGKLRGSHQAVLSAWWELDDCGADISAWIAVAELLE